MAWWGGSEHPETGFPTRRFFATMASKTAVLLLGHGSHIDAGSSRPIHDAAARLRKSSPAREVRVAFWKEEPSLRNAFLLIESPRVVAVPMFTSEGYFTDSVLPRELGIEPPLSDVDGLAVRYTRPVGTHPLMASVVLERARGLTAGDAVDSTTLVILGHGTERHRASGDVVRRLTEQLSGSPGFASVRCAFLDEEPRIVPALEAIDTARAVVVPFFIAEGWHVGQTIPRDLGLDRGRALIDGTEVVYSDPVGTHPALDEVIEQIVEEAEADGWGQHTEGEGTDPERRSAAMEARAAFIDWIDGGGPDGRTFLETRARRSGPEHYEIRHVADAGRDSADLDRSRDPLRALEIARWTRARSYRPLRTAPDLAGGWLLEGLSASELWEAYAGLYPVAPVHWYLGNRSRVRPTSFREAAARQTGIYAPVKELTDAQVLRVSSSRCGPEGCLRRVVWPLTSGEDSPEPSPDPVPREEVPCPEPCSLFFTEARELIVREREGVLRETRGVD